MAKKDKDKIMLTEHVLEVRHAASGSFLDVRGYVADYIKEKGSLPHWKIDTNVVNFRDLPDRLEKEGAFAGYKSAGYIAFNPETKNYFSDRASSFWKVLIKNGHYKVPPLKRFGVRTKVFLPSEKSFDEINDLFFKSFFSNQAMDLLGGQEKDIQIVVDLSEEKFEVRISGGPIHENEVSNYLRFKAKEFDKCGLFLDIDYYYEKSIKHDQIPKMLKEAMDLTWKKIEKIASKLGL
jgi:hypothetical protein